MKGVTSKVTSFSVEYCQFFIEISIIAKRCILLKSDISVIVKLIRI